MSQRLDWRGSCRAIAIAATILLCFVFTIAAAAQDGSTRGNSASADSGVPLASADNTPVSSTSMFVPESSVVRSEDAGRRAHTNYVLRTINGSKPQPMARPGIGPLTNGTFPEIPASLACVYKVGPTYTGCSPASPYHTTFPNGGSNVIVLVDAFDNPNATSDMATFDSQWGLPAPPSFSVVYANGNGHCTTPPPNAGWALESSLDIEWAHAMAPKANIVLVEACSNSNVDLYYAELVAGSVAYSFGGGDISNSWGEGEYSGEVTDDANFFTYWSNVAYFASAGDSGCGAAYPSSSPWVVSAGGTTVNRKTTNEGFVSESCWSGSGGGISTVEQWSPSSTGFRGNGMGPWSAYQYPQFGGYLAGAFRHTPDFAFDSDPNSGVYVYSGYNGGWFIVGGTSVASPSLAGIVNLAGNKLGQAPQGGGYYTNEENNLLYDQLFAAKAYGANFYDVKTGSNGCSVGVKWDYCTGVGSPRGLLGK